MEKLLSIRLPLAWFLMVIIATVGAGIVVMLLSNGSAPSNAVLIESLEDEDQARSTPAPDYRLPTTDYRLVSPTHTAVVEATRPPTPSVVSIYVSGAVAAPGVYTLPAGSRVDQALMAAGGASGEADLERINLAAYVSDQDHVRVPRIGETPSAVEANSTRARSTSPAIPPVSATNGEKLDLNRASALELEELPGIGPVIAARIVDDRDRHGPFKSVDDLKRVSGIKDGIMSQVREYLTIAP